MNNCFTGYRRLLFIFIILSGFIQVQSQTLTIEINKIKSDKGDILLSVYNNSKGFPYASTSSIKTLSVKAKPGGVMLSTADLPPGTYAIALFHDVDGNRKLTTNMIGIPKEGYAFSNNASNFFGVPGFKDASFKLTGDTTIVINMKHF
jgi:uncharacterized protein (DUF2141 family)